MWKVMIARSECFLLQTDLPGVRLLGRGKVRDNYDLGDQL
jgi:hypothetical protein